MTIKNKNIKINFKDYLSEIYENPQKIHQSYKIFHNFSINNRILAESQMVQLEPINTFVGWKKLNRHVKKGSKAIKLFLPLKHYKEEKDEHGKEKKELVSTSFILKPFWFSLSQTEGENFQEKELPDFDIDEKLQKLKIKKVAFNSINGNCQGFAIPKENKIAINPMAFSPNKTLFHEIAHCLLHKEEDLMIDGKTLTRSVKEFEAETVAYLICCSLGQFESLEYSRGYIASWIQKEDIKEENFQRAFKVAEEILNI